jgi:hypothetical protein
LELLDGVVQPFDLRLIRDDLHVMAFFAGHPTYEAVEAMIRRRPAGGAVIRAILTRHDQSQIDHVNDEALLAAERSSRRETCLRAIALHEEVTPSGPRARLELESHIGERVALDVVAAGPPDARWGGLTDPGRHSPESVLPLMWRAKSTLAGPATRVRIGERELPATRGYYTLGHSLGLVRAGRIELRPLARPEPIELGGEWLFECGERRIAYRIAGRAAGEAWRIERRDESAEYVVAGVANGRLRLTEIGVGPGLRLTFGAGSRFAASIDGAEAVTGRYESHVRGDLGSLHLQPLQPEWARARAVEVHCSRARDMLTLTATFAPGRRGGEGDAR